MNCPTCSLKYDDQEIHPRILSTCGHTFCEPCLKNRICNKSCVIICPICHMETITLDVNLLTKNLALLDKNISSLKQEKENLRLEEQKSLCSIHLKVLEAFCEVDQEMLCVSCILDNLHKNHSLIPISRAFINQYRNFEEFYQENLNLQDGLSNLKKNIEIYKLEKSESFKTEKEIRLKFYDFLLKIISEKKTMEEKNLDSQYQTLLKQIDKILEDIILKINKIFELKQFHKNIHNLSQIEFLKGSLQLQLQEIKYENKLSNYANYEDKFEQLKKNKAQSFNKEEEFNQIKKIFFEQIKSEDLSENQKLNLNPKKKSKPNLQDSEFIDKSDIIDIKSSDCKLSLTETNFVKDDKIQINPNENEEINYLLVKDNNLHKDFEPKQTSNQMFCEIDLEPIMKPRKTLPNDFKTSQNKRVKILSLQKKNKKVDANCRETIETINPNTNYQLINNQSLKKSTNKIIEVNSVLNTKNLPTLKNKFNQEKVNHKIDLSDQSETLQPKKCQINLILNINNNTIKNSQKNITNNNLHETLTKSNQDHLRTSPDASIIKTQENFNHSTYEDENIKTLLSDFIYKKNCVSSKTIPYNNEHFENFESPLSKLNKIDMESKSFLDDSFFNVKSFNNDLASLYYTGNNNLILIGGKSDNISRKFCPETNTWSAFDISVERSDFVAVNYKENKILLIGGKIQKDSGSEIITDSIDLMNLKDKTLKKLEIKLRQPRINFGGVYLNSRLFVAGGSNGKDVLNLFECFEKRKKVWSDLPRMLTKRKEFAMTLGPDNCIYVIGGSDEKENYLKSVDKFDVEKNIWIKLEDMNQKRKGCSVVCMPDGLYIFGGYDGCQYLKSVEKYDIPLKKWKTIHEMNFSRCFASAVASSDFQYIYIMGGYDGKPLNSVERYDVLVGRWDNIKTLPQPRYRHQCLFFNE